MVPGVSERIQDGWSGGLAKGSGIDGVGVGERIWNRWSRGCRKDPGWRE
jgi:hypothetical protein